MTSVNSCVKIFSKENIDSLPWPDTVDAKRAKGYLVPLIKNGVRPYVENVNTTLFALVIDDLVLPLTVNHTEYENSYVCSVYSHYITCALQFLTKVDNALIRLPVTWLMKGFGLVLKAGKINKVACVNNWLVATNLYPKITAQQIHAAINALKDAFPDHAILMRSIHSYGDTELSQIVQDSGFNLVPSRLIYLVDTKTTALFQARIFKSDLKALSESSYHSNDLAPTEITVKRLTALYRSIYLEKHTEQNPAFTEEFVRLIVEEGLLQLRGLHKEGQIDAIAGFFICDNVMTSPFLGYDTSAAKSDKLYRLICTVMMLHAKEQRFVFHLSSGAGFFKKVRKAETALEYMAVYDQHLPLHRKAPWRVLSFLFRLFGLKMMQKYQT